MLSSLARDKSLAVAPLFSSHTSSSFLLRFLQPDLQQRGLARLFPYPAASLAIYHHSRKTD